jgi:hypothetical protein
MKSRLALFLILFSFSLTACNLAEDITPPPGYSSPTPQPTVSLAALTVEPSSKPTTSNSSATPTSLDLTALPTQTSSNPSLTVTVSGIVSVASGTALPEDTLATLLVYSTASQKIVKTMQVPILPDGKYSFNDVPADSNKIYLVTVDYQDVTFDSAPLQFNETTSLYDMPVAVYDTTDNLNVLTITQTHFKFDFSTSGIVQVMALYVINNPSENAVIITSDGSSVPFIQVPQDAASVQYQLHQDSSALLKATNGFAFLPGSDKQYGIIVTFTMPYSKRLVYTQPFDLPVSSTTIIVPEGVNVRSDQLSDAGTQSTSGTTYHLFQAGSLASGSTLTLTISGMPGDKTGLVIDQQAWLIIGIAAVGLLLIALGVFLFLRDRKLRKEEELKEENISEQDSQLGDRDGIMDAIIALDDQYKTGDISNEAYEKRRDELKERLKNLL